MVGRNKTVKLRLKAETNPPTTPKAKKNVFPPKPLRSRVEPDQIPYDKPKVRLKRTLANTEEKMEYPLIPPEEFKYLREQLFLTQKNVANLLGVTQRTITRYEDQGKSNTPIPTTVALAFYFIATTSPRHELGQLLLSPAWTALLECHRKGFTSILVERGKVAAELQDAYVKVLRLSDMSEDEVEEHMEKFLEGSLTSQDMIDMRNKLTHGLAPTK